jgi:hypothetical protein
MYSPPSQKQASTRNYVTSLCIVVLFGTSLSGYALLNALQAAANYFDAK